MNDPAPVPTINLGEFDLFREHPWVTSLDARITRDSKLADTALRTLINDLELLNREFYEQHRRTLFVSVDGRVKKKDSLLKKLFKYCHEHAEAHGLVQDTVLHVYEAITDLCGVRFSCPYLDQIMETVTDEVRPWLQNRGYATNLEEHPDKDVLENGDDFGYRSYHFFVRVPAPIDIYGNREFMLCEIQARTELQHVWAVKSHQLLYKPEQGWERSDEHVISDMKAISNNLNSVDQLFVSVRERSKGNRGES